MKASKIASLSSRSFLYAVALLGLAVAVANLVPIPNVSSMLSKNLSTFILAILSIVLGYVVEERRQREKDHRQVARLLRSLESRQTEEIERVISTLAGGPVLLLPDTVAVYKHVAERISVAKSYVYDLSFGPSVTKLLSEDEQVAFQEYVNAKTATINKGIVYQEVWSFPDDVRRERCRTMLALNRVNYEARYYDIDHERSPPLLNFTLIDDEVVLAFYAGDALRGNPDLHLATGNRLVRDLFLGYYNAVWQKARHIQSDIL